MVDQDTTATEEKSGTELQRGSGTEVFSQDSHEQGRVQERLSGFIERSKVTRLNGHGQKNLFLSSSMVSFLEHFNLA